LHELPGITVKMDIKNRSLREVLMWQHYNY